MATKREEGQQKKLYPQNRVYVRLLVMFALSFALIVVIILLILLLNAG